MTIPTLVERLRANAKFLHLAGRIGESLLENEAADEIERLRVQVRQADARGDEALRRAHKAEAAQSDPAAWYDSKSGQVDFGSWKPTRKPSAPDAEWLPFYSAPVRPVPAEPVAWVPYCFKDCSNGRAGEYRLSEVEAAPFAMVDLNSWACVPLFASPPPAQPTALERYTEAMKDCEPDTHIENLRFFCSLAMRGQDWLDVEPFFDAVIAAQPTQAKHIPASTELAQAIDDALGLFELPPIRVCRSTHASLLEAAKARGLALQALVRERLAPYQLIAQPEPVAGWKMVPTEPTEDMLFAAEMSQPRGYRALYEVMVAASPPPAQPVNEQPDLVLRLQQRCVDWGAYWRAPDDHGVHLTKQQACDLLCTALGVEVEIAGHPLTACDDNDSPWLVCKPCVAEGQCANAAQPTDLFKGMPFAEAKKAIMLLDAEAARGLAISLMIQNGLHEKYAAQPKRKPLSKTQIKEAWDLSCLVETTGTTATLVEHFARAIERLTLGEQG